MDNNTGSYKDSLKSLDTEEHIDLAFYRPIGYAWACLAKKLGVTPNAITIASIFLGVGAGVAFYFNDIWVNILGMVLLVWANSFDSADGQLARMTKQYSRIGRILDGVSGDLWFAAIYIAICLRENNTSFFFQSYPWLIWLIAVVTGLCHAKQAAMADYYRQFHLYFLKGEGGSELDSGDALQTKYNTMSWRKNFFAKLVLLFYKVYAPTGSHDPCYAEAARRYPKALRQRYAERCIPCRIPPFESSSDEIHKYPVFQLALHSSFLRSFRKNAVALFRF